MDAITVSHPPHIFSNVTDNLTSSECMHRFTRLYKTRPTLFLVSASKFYHSVEQIRDKRLSNDVVYVVLIHGRRERLLVRRPDRRKIVSPLL